VKIKKVEGYYKYGQFENVGIPSPIEFPLFDYCDSCEACNNCHTLTPNTKIFVHRMLDGLYCPSCYERIDGFRSDPQAKEVIWWFNHFEKALI